MRERVIERYLVERVKAEGGKAIKFTSSGNRGVPDRMCVFPCGVLVFVECKRPGNGLDPLQKVWFKILRGLGQLCICIDSKDKVDGLIRWYRKKAAGVKRFTLEEGGHARHL